MIEFGSDDDSLNGYDADGTNKIELYIRNLRALC